MLLTNVQDNERSKFKKNNKKGGFLEQSEISHISQPS